MYTFLRSTNPTVLTAFQNREFGSSKPDPELFFRDGVRKIDFVLAFEDQDGGLGGGHRRLSLFGDTGHSLGSVFCKAKSILIFTCGEATLSKGF